MSALSSILQRREGEEVDGGSDVEEIRKPR